MPRSRSLSITAQNTFSAPNKMSKGGVLTLSGTFVATVSLQRRGTDLVWVDVTNNAGAAQVFTVPGTYTISPSRTSADYRFGVKTGNFTSGTVVGLLEGL